MITPRTTPKEHKHSEPKFFICDCELPDEEAEKARKASFAWESACDGDGEVIVLLYIEEGRYDCPNCRQELIPMSEYHS